MLAPLVLLDGLSPIAAIGLLAEIIATSALVTYAVAKLDKDSIVTLRRMFGLTFAATFLWALPVLVGSSVSWVTHNNQYSLNEFAIGAFLAWSLQLLVVNGGFIYGTTKSLLLAAVQPLSTLLLTSALLPHPPRFAFTIPLGLAILLITTVFLLKFKRFTTGTTHINSLEILQSFLKTWVSQNTSSLESYFSMYSKAEAVVTKVLIASTADRTAALVLPGVHPGPFFPVGSYNISELIFNDLRKGGVTPMILHGVGGHERNLPTNDLAKRYAATVAAGLQAHIPTRTSPARKMRGPTKTQFGCTTITTLGFGSQIVVFLSNAPYNTDDLPPAAIDQAVVASKESGVELILVDAHNSIGGEECQQLAIDWKSVFSSNLRATEEDFELGVAHSSELDFNHGSDISDGGVGTLVFSKHASKHAVVVSDSNNAALGLRQTVADELKKEGVDLIELCTSDTHNSAARSLTNRGYHALGEESDCGDVVGAIKKLEKMAEGRLSQGSVTTLTSDTTLPLIGDKSLDDFATLTKESLRFAKRYAAVSLTLVTALCCFTLFL